MSASAAPRMPVIRLHPGADAAFVQALYHDVVIASRCLAGVRGEFLVGAGANVDAPAAIDRLPSPEHRLVCADESGFRVAVTEGMTGEVIFEDRVASLAALAVGDREIVIGASSHLRLACGAMEFLVAPTAAPPAVPRPRTRARDHRSALLAAGGVLLVAVLIALTPPAAKTLSYDPDLRGLRYLTTLTVPAAPPPAPRAAPGAGRAASRGAAPPGARRATGAAGSVHARSAPRPADPRDAGRSGILGVLLAHQGASWQSMFSRQGALLDGEAQILRDLQGGDPTAAASAGGLQTIGTGASGPGGNELTGAPPGIGNGLGPCLGCSGMAGDRVARLGPRRPVAVPQIMADQLTTRGSLDKEIVRRVIHRHLNEIKYCYERELIRRPSLLGRVVVQFTILPIGRVAAAALASSTVANAAVESCIVGAVRRWEFPMPRGGGLVAVSYPFLLVPAEAP
jgi:hypothetical protein